MVVGKAFELAADFVAAERGQAMEAKLEDRLHLRFAQACRSSPLACGSTASTSAM